MDYAGKEIHTYFCRRTDSPAVHGMCTSGSRCMVDGAETGGFGALATGAVDAGMGIAAGPRLAGSSWALCKMELAFGGGGLSVAPA